MRRRFFTNALHTMMCCYRLYRTAIACAGESAKRGQRKAADLRPKHSRATTKNHQARTTYQLQDWSFTDAAVIPKNLVSPSL